MTTRVRLFARARDLAGAETVSVELPSGATVGDLRRALVRAVPALAGLLERSAVGVNAEYAADDTLIPPSAEVAVIPPVSGGAES
jgi:molybdopterin converting factor subunit 1